MKHCIARLGTWAVVCVALVATHTANALTFEVSATAPGVWTYTLTYEPWDNYSIFQPTTTITLSGLHGVTAASGPVSTDFENADISALNLAWTPQVLEGGTKVKWTHVGPGTGNWWIPKHVYGFQVLASGAVTGTVSLVTDGFARDIPNNGTTDPILDGRDLDLTTTVLGPVMPMISAQFTMLLTELAGVPPGRSLVDKVALSQTYHEAGDDRSACAVLAAFVREVIAVSGRKIDPVLATQIVGDAESLRSALGCN